MKITLAYEIGDRVLAKIPAGPMKFTDTVGVIQEINLHFDEETDTSSTVFVLNVNENLYNISYPQIIKIFNDETHTHDYREICRTCGDWA